MPSYVLKEYRREKPGSARLLFREIAFEVPEGGNPVMAAKKRHMSDLLEIPGYLGVVFDDAGKQIWECDWENA